MQLCNGVLCGLVAVTPGCGVINVWAGIIVGVLGAAVFLVLDRLMLRALMDDVVAAVPMHLGCGVLGTLFVGLFAREDYVKIHYNGGPAGEGASLHTASMSEDPCCGYGMQVCAVVAATEAA